MLINIDLDQFIFNLYLVVVGSHKLLLQRPKEGKQTLYLLALVLVVNNLWTKKTTPHHVTKSKTMI